MHSSLADQPQDSTNAEHESLGERLRRLRTATGCTVAEIREASGVPGWVLLGMEDGKLTPLSGHLEALARVYGVSLDDLVTQTPPVGPGGRSSE